MKINALDYKCDQGNESKKMFICRNPFPFFNVIKYWVNKKGKKCLDPEKLML